MSLWWLLLVAVVAGCAPVPARVVGPGTPPMQPLVVGADRLFDIDWQVSEQDQRPLLWGYLVNNSPYTVRDVRILADGLDPSGQIAAQRLGWAVGGPLGPFSRVYFSIPAPGRYPAYQVRVFSYDRIETDDFFDR